MPSELQTVTEELAHAHDVPGVAVGVLHAGSETYAGAGVTSVDNPLPVNEETLFLIGSTTKTFTATAVLGLVEEGRIDLDAPVRHYLPEFQLGDAAALDRVTVRHLLTHTGGWRGDVDEEYGWGDDAIARGVAAIADAPQLFAPGAGWSYCNTGFDTAAHLLQRLCGTPYEGVIWHRILEPLGLNQSFFFPWQVASRRHAVGHTRAGGSTAVAHTWGLDRSAAGSGGLASTARDQIRWAKYHLGGTSEPGPAPLTDETRLSMQDARGPHGPTLTGMGLGWLLTRNCGLDLVGHGGNVSGIQVSDFQMVPDHDFAMTVLTNGPAGGVLADALLTWCLENILGARRELPQSVTRLSGPELEAFEGRYDGGWCHYLIAAQDGGLECTTVPLDSPASAATTPARSIELVSIDPGRDRFARAAAPTAVDAQFERDESGRVIWLHMGLRMCRRLDAEMRAE